MQLISLHSHHGVELCDWPAQDALSGVVGTIGEPDFGATALAELNRWMPLAWWSVYTLFEDAPPVLHAHGIYGGVPNGTLESWQVYRASLYRRDATFVQARELAATGSTGLVHWDANEIPPEHRSAIYSRHDLRERLSIVTGTERQGLLAINLYRHLAQPALSADAIDAVGQMARPLVACVNRHITLRARQTIGSPLLDRLTSREKEVCERLLKGWTQDGIAADLGLTPATVKTYRDRAFRRLSIRYRHELFALIAGPEGRL